MISTHNKADLFGLNVLSVWLEQKLVHKCPTNLKPPHPSINPCCPRLFIPAVEELTHIMTTGDTPVNSSDCSDAGHRTRDWLRNRSDPGPPGYVKSKNTNWFLHTDLSHLTAKNPNDVM